MSNKQRRLTVAELEAVTLPTLKWDVLKAMAVAQALKKTGGSVAKAAKLMGIGRATMYRWIQASPPELPYDLDGPPPGPEVG